MGLLAILGYCWLSLSGLWIQWLEPHRSSLTKASFFPHSLPSLIFPLQRTEYSSLTGSPKWTLLSSCTTKVPLCGVNPGFLSKRQCDFYIRCHGDAARREENGALTSGFSWLPGQTVHLGRAGSSAVPVCLCADNSSTWKGETGTWWRYLSNTM